MKSVISLVTSVAIIGAGFAMMALLGASCSESKDGKPKVEVTSENFCDQLAAVACYDMRNCCVGNEVETLTGIAIPTTSESECTSSIKLLCEKKYAQELYAVASGKATLNAANANACFAALLHPDNACYIEQLKAPWTDACIERIFVGTGTTDTYCSSDLHCASAFYCNNSSARCEAFGSQDGDCSGIKRCAEGFYCDSSLKCQQKKAASADCISTEECADGLYCDLATTNKCKTRITSSSEECGADNECESGYCLMGVCELSEVITQSIVCYDRTQCGGGNCLGRVCAENKQKISNYCLASFVAMLDTGIPGSSGEGMPSVGTVTEANYCEEAAKVACYDMWKCCTSQEISSYLYGSYTALSTPTEFSCRRDVQLYCQKQLAQYFDSIGKNRTKFNSANATMYLNMLIAPENTCTFIPIYKHLYNYFNSMFEGEVQVGGYCLSDYECVTDSFCGDYGRKCVAYVDINQQCGTVNGFNIYCRPNLYCNTSLATPVCAERIAVNQQCSVSDSCVSPYYCLSGYCNNHPAQYCSSYTPCPTGDTCIHICGLDYYSSIDYYCRARNMITGSN